MVLALELSGCVREPAAEQSLRLQDTIDVLGYPTSAATPALLGELLLLHSALGSWLHAVPPAYVDRMTRHKSVVRHSIRSVLLNSSFQVCRRLPILRGSSRHHLPGRQWHHPGQNEVSPAELHCSSQLQPSSFLLSQTVWLAGLSACMPGCAASCSERLHPSQCLCLGIMCPATLPTPMRLHPVSSCSAF